MGTVEIFETGGEFLGVNGYVGSGLIQTACRYILVKFPPPGTEGMKKVRFCSSLHL